MSQYSNLGAILDSLAEQAKKNPISIRDALDKLNHFGFSLIVLILVLPFMQPFPVGPISVLGGMTFAILGLQILRKYPAPVLPEKILKTSIGAQGWTTISKASKFIIRWTKKISKPRLEKFVSGEFAIKIEGSILLSGGILMAIPFGVLPFNNFFPGLAILFATLAQLEKDGLFILIAIFWLIFSIFYFVIFFMALYYISIESIQYLPNWLVSLI